MTATITTPTAVKISGQAELQYSKREAMMFPAAKGTCWHSAKCAGQIRTLPPAISSPTHQPSTSKRPTSCKAMGPTRATTQCVMAATRLLRSGMGR